MRKPPLDEQRRLLIRQILRELNVRSSDIEASAVISTDGLVIAAALGSADPDRFGAMCSALLALAQRAVHEVDRGALRQVLVEADNGSILLNQVGEDAVLAVSTRPTLQLGMVFLDAKRTAMRLSKALA